MRMRRKENILAWGWVDVLRTATMRRILEISSEQGGKHYRSCYSTATNPRIGKTMIRLSRRARGGSSTRFGESVWWGNIKGRSRVVGLGSARFFRAGGVSVIAVGAVEKELSCLRCCIPSCPSRIRQVSCRCVFLKSLGRLLARIIISNHSTIRICILHRDGSFLLLRVLAREFCV